MRSSNAVRDVAGAFLGAVVIAAGLVTLTPAPWSIAIPVSVGLGSAGLLLDLLAWDRPVPRSARAWKWSVGLAGFALSAAALMLSFVLGRLTQPADEGYPFLSLGGNFAGSAPIYSTPLTSTAVIQDVAPGDQILVDCFVRSDGQLWYRVSPSPGWASEENFIPAPYTGRGGPPPCPR